MAKSPPTPENLKSRLWTRATITFVIVLAMLFIPAGSLKYWQAWSYIAIIFVPMIFFTFYFLKRDPALVERRLESQEQVPAQKKIMKWASLIFLAGFVVPGFDFRFGWSHVPLWLTVFSQFASLAGYLITFWVLRTNSFASRTIRVEKEQTVVSSGPYRMVRHPMYSGAAIMLIFTPLALGSYWALPLFLLVLPMIVFRLLNEEEILHHELPGYAEYSHHTRFRLIPYLW
jgi:protein-S-isoprenylcysteine O-methyltransferase Ste14